MKKNIIQKILESHLISGSMQEGEEIVVSVNKTLSHDLSSIIVAQILEAVNADKIQVEKSVFFCDHNVLCTVSDNADDHHYLKTAAERFGIYFSKPGNGICHTLMCERFASPWDVISGGDSHTPTSGAVGALAIGTGGLSVAKAALGKGFRFKVPKVLGVKLTGSLNPGVAAKDVALELLRRISVKGGLGKVIEYFGDGVSNLSITERMTITNMSIETGATSGVFICDEVTREFLKAQGREEEYKPLVPDDGAQYDELVEINMSELKPLAACPSSPDKVVPAEELGDVKVGSVFIGSCTNSSYLDLARAAAVLEGKHVHKDIDCVIAAGSRQIFEQLIEDGIIDILVKAGCRVLECACGPCIGIGQVPRTNGVTVRTSNRNFPGRSGSLAADVYLVSPETAAATAISGKITTAIELVSGEKLEKVSKEPISHIDDSYIIAPLPDEERRQIVPVKGPNVSDLPIPEIPAGDLNTKIIIRLGDNITTDDIIPGGAEIVRFIANVPAFAEYTFCYEDPDFVKRAKEFGSSIIVGGENYGQGSSREQAAILPLYLGVRAVIAKSFARIHKENLVNWGILPLTFIDDEAYEIIERDDEICLKDLEKGIQEGIIEAVLPSKDVTIRLKLDVTQEDKNILLAGGELNRLAQ